MKVYTFDVQECTPLYNKNVHFCPIKVYILANVSSRSYLFQHLLVFLRFQYFQCPFYTFVCFIHHLEIFIHIP